MKFNKRSLWVILIACSVLLILGVGAFIGTSTNFDVWSKFDFGASDTEATTDSGLVNRFILGNQPVSQYESDSYSGRLGVLEATTYSTISFVSPSEGAEIVRGNDSDNEDNLMIVSNTGEIMSFVYVNGTENGIQNINCSFYVNSIFVGSDVTNSSGNCNVSFSKVGFDVGSIPVLVNYTALDYILVSNSSEINVELISFTVPREVTNDRSGDFQVGDAVILEFNVTKTNSSGSFVYDPQNITVDVQDTWENLIERQLYPSGNDIVRLGEGRYYSKFIASSAEKIKWEVSVYDSNYSGYIASTRHSDQQIDPATASMNVSVVNSSLAKQTISNLTLWDRNDYLLNSTSLSEGEEFNRVAALDDTYDLKVVSGDLELQFYDLNVSSVNSVVEVQKVDAERATIDNETNTYNVNTIVALDNSSFSLATGATIKLPLKYGSRVVEKICKSTDWNFGTLNATTWTCSNLSDYNYINDSSYIWFNVSGFSAYTSGLDAVCGNAVEEPGEECDYGGKCDNGKICNEDSDCAGIGGETCEPQAGDGCDVNCQREDCGNGIIEEWLEEVCDGTALGGETCESQGFSGGTLSCELDCGDFVTSACTNVTEYCGDGICNNGETCSTCPGDCGICDDSCFPGYTKILMADGSEKEIKDVEVGEMVRSYDFWNKEFKVAEVLELEAPLREELYEINGVLNVTDEHPLYIKKAGTEIIGWGAFDVQKAKEDTRDSSIANNVIYEIKEGDYLFDEEGKWIKINEIKYFPGEIQTYNLKTVDKYYTFFANGFLAHNKNGCDDSRCSSVGTTTYCDGDDLVEEICSEDSEGCLVYSETRTNCLASGGFCEDARCVVCETCEDLGYECGTWENNCGNSLNCGTCGEGFSCSPLGLCVEECVPNIVCKNTTCGVGDEYSYPYDCYDANGCGLTIVEPNPTPCPKCGNGICSDGETSISCPDDCYCGDGVCKIGEEDCNSCEDDCGVCACGDGVCAVGETSSSCPSDCYCGNGNCDTDESCRSCEDDCGVCPPDYVETEIGEGDEKCSSLWNCTAWGVCKSRYSLEDVVDGAVDSKSERVCVDENGCLQERVEYKPCSVKVEIEAEKAIWCFEEYIEVYDKKTSELVARIRESEIAGYENLKRVDIDLSLSEFTGYCDYCFNGVLDYDEEGVDCGGPSCPACTYPWIFFNWRLWLVMFLWMFFGLLFLAGWKNEEKSLAIIEEDLGREFRESVQEAKPGSKTERNIERKIENFFKKMFGWIRVPKFKRKRGVREEVSRREGVSREKHRVGKHVVPGKVRVGSAGSRVGRKKGFFARYREHRRRKRVVKLHNKIRQWRKKGYATAKLEAKLRKLNG